MPKKIEILINNGVYTSKVEIKDKSFEALEKLKNDSGADDFVDVFINALKTYEAVVKQFKDGGEVVFRPAKKEWPELEGGERIGANVYVVECLDFKLDSFLKSAEKAGLKAKHMGEIERFSKDGKGYKFSKHLIIVDWG